MNIHDIEISHPDKLIFPKKKIRKIEMIEYYDKISDHMLPYLKDRPLTLQRFPDGIKNAGFYQKNAGEYFPDFIERIMIATKEGENEQVLCNNKKSLIYLANQGTICFHIWLSRKDNIDKPDKVIFDLDPPENAFDKIKEAAKIVGDFLREKGKEPQLMSSGKNGLHVWYTKRRNHTFDEVRESAKEMADDLASKHPDLLTTATLKKKREGRIFLDYLRNAYAQTAVCPFSLRPIESAGVATPLSWDELSGLKSADQYNYSNIFERLSKK